MARVDGRAVHGAAARAAQEDLDADAVGADAVDARWPVAGGCLMAESKTVAQCTVPARRRLSHSCTAES